MKIQGRLGWYDVTWSQCGWTYARANIYKKVARKFLWWEWEDKVLLNPEKDFEVVGLSHAEEMFPEEMRNWFQGVVHQYENYVTTWEKYYE